MGIGAGVAIVGIGCRFPGGVFTPDQYWNFMLQRGDAVIEIPQDRWNVDLFYDADPDAPGRAYTRHGGFVTLSPWDFDAEFFGISPREAEVMDPQQRWVLEVAWEALDDAGMSGAVSGRNVAGLRRRVHVRQPDSPPPALGATRRQQLHRHQQLPRYGVQPTLACPRLARSEHDHRHRMFVVARGDTPGHAGSGAWRM